MTAGAKILRNLKIQNKSIKYSLLSIILMVLWNQTGSHKIKLGWTNLRKFGPFQCSGKMSWARKKIFRFSKTVFTGISERNWLLN